MTTLPVITNLRDMLAHLLDMDEQINPDLLSESIFRVGRNDGPTLVAELFGQGCLMDAGVLAVGVEAAWVGAEFPTQSVGTDVWSTLFEVTGYLEGADRRPDLQPTEPIRLYRGANERAARGWSWTDNSAVAEWFAQRPIQVGHGKVWTAMVHPDRLLAHFPDGRDEFEYVVAADGLPVEVA